MITAQDDIYDTLRTSLLELFDIPAEKVTYEARLYEDLDLDSIDAVDLVIRLQQVTGRRFQPAEFKSVRTVGDIVEKVQTLLAA